MPLSLHLAQMCFSFSNNQHWHHSNYQSFQFGIAYGLTRPSSSSPHLRGRPGFEAGNSQVRLLFFNSVPYVTSCRHHRTVFYKRGMMSFSNHKLLTKVISVSFSSQGTYGNQTNASIWNSPLRVLPSSVAVLRESPYMPFLCSQTLQGRSQASQSLYPASLQSSSQTHKKTENNQYSLSCNPFCTTSGIVYCLSQYRM